MTGRNTLEHSGERTRHQDHRDEDASESKQDNYPGADQRDGQARNEFREKLLEKLDGRAAAVLKYQHDLAEYDAGDRKSVIDAYAESFNGVEFNNPRERYEAAQELSQAVFNPLYKQIGLRELTENGSFSPETLQALESEGVSQVSYRSGEAAGHRGISEIYLSVDDMESAQRIIDKTGGQAYLVSRETMEDYERQFAGALYDSAGEKDRTESCETLNRILDEAIAYSRGEVREGPGLHEWREPQKDESGGHSGEEAEGAEEHRVNPLKFLEGLREKYLGHAENRAAVFRDSHDPEGREAHEEEAAASGDGAAVNFEEKDAPEEPHINHIAEFHQMEYKGTFKEIYEEAEKYAQAVFQPMYHRLEYLESLLEKEPEGHSREIQAAVNLAETLSAGRLDHYREQFTEVLYESKMSGGSDGPDLRYNPTEEILNEAAAYLQGKIDYNADGDIDFQTGQELGVYLESALGEKIESNWYTARNAAYNGGALEPAAQAYEALRTSYVREMTRAIEKGNEQEYNSIAEDMADRNYAFAFSVKQNTGFVTGEDYRPPELPEEFSSSSELRDYIEQVESTLETVNHRNGNMKSTSQGAVEFLAEHCRKNLEHWEKGPEYERTVETIRHTAHDAAKGIDYLMQPRRPAGS